MPTKLREFMEHVVCCPHCSEELDLVNCEADTKKIILHGKCTNEHCGAVWKYTVTRSEE